MSKSFRLRLSMALLGIWAVAGTAQAQQGEMTVEEIITKHVTSVGAAERLAGTKSRVAQGSAQFKIRRGGGGDAEGTETHIGATGIGSRSHLGAFFSYRPDLLRDGLLGGALSTAWPLLHSAEMQATLKYVGQKKIGNHNLHRVDYLPAGKERGLQVSLFFEPEKFRHVLTVYRLEVGPGMSTSPNVTARQDDSLYTLEESFSEFRTVDGMDLPTRWKLRYERSVQRGVNTLMEWDFAMQKVQHNQRIDPKAFTPKLVQSN